jgi:hypothetical protein
MSMDIIEKMGLTQVLANVKQKTTTYKIRTEYYENMRPNKNQESPKTNLGEPSL